MRLALAVVVTLLFASLPGRAAAPIPLPAAQGFVPNLGQAPAEVLYFASVPGGAVYLTASGLVLDSWKSQKTTDDETTHRRGRVTRIEFSGAHGVLPEADGRTASRLAFLIGNDPAKWRRDVPLYERATYRELWPGVDLTIAFERGGAACRLEARPDAHLGDVRFVMHRGDGAAPAPIGIDELSALFPKPAEAVVRANPGALLWSTYLGGSAEEIGWSSTLDSAGNAIVTGLNTSSLFPVTEGAYDEIYTGLGDVFVSKISADGSELLWSTFLGGSALLLDYGYAVEVDANDNPVVTGYTRSEDFPITDGAWATEYGGEADVFVSKLNASGSDLLWSTFIGGSSHDIGYDLALDAEGNPVIVGRSLSFDFPIGVGAYDTSANGEEDGFLTKLTANGDDMIWSTMFGGQMYDGVQAVQLDADGSPIICGYTGSFDFPEGLSAQGLYDIFLAKLSPDGSALAWSRLVGGGNYDYGTDLVLDSQGNPVYCGSTGSPDFPVTRGAYDESYNGDDDVVVGKLANADGSPMWATFVGGSAPIYEIAHGIVMGVGDRPIVTGSTPSSDFPTTLDALDRSYNGFSDGFLLRLSAGGDALEWSTFLGGPGDDYAYELAKNRTGSVVVTGAAGEGFPATAGAYDADYNGDISDVFVTRVALATTGPAILDEKPTPDSMALLVSPNPIASGARISFTLREASSAVLEVFDAQGRRCSRVDGGALTAGEHSIEWNAVDASGRRLASGVYAVRVTAGSQVQSRQVVLLR